MAAVGAIDEQQAAAYAWENKWESWNRPSASRYAVRKAIRAAERKYAIPHTHIIFVKNNRSTRITDKRSGMGLKLATLYEPNIHQIRVRPRHCNIAVGLHEVAHAIHDKIFGNVSTVRLQAHGPLWLGIYMWLLIHFEIAPREAIVASARAAGLKWASLARIGPRQIRRCYERRIDEAQFV